MYKKTAIRQFFTQYLKNNVVSVSDRVFSGRIDVIDDVSYPYLTVFSKDEDIIEYFTSHTERELELKVGCVVSSNQTQDADFDEIIENLIYEVEQAMSKILTIALQPGENYRLFNDIVLTGSQSQSNSSSSNDIGGAILNYRITYEYENPVDPLVLEDFDLQGSIDNLIITNPGVPPNA